MSSIYRSRTTAREALSSGDARRIAEETAPKYKQAPGLVRKYFVRGENDHDLDRIMDTFADDGVMHYNHMPFGGDEGIRGAHILIGMSASPGAFSGSRHIIDAEHYTDEETVVEARLVGKHSNEFLVFAASEREVELPFVAFYRFDDNGKLTSERVVMNLGPLQS